MKSDPKKPSSLLSQIELFYSAFPYPHYPLFSKPRWQDAYLNSYQFCNRMLNQVDLNLHLDTQPTLLMGCGEILPLLINKWAASKNPIYAVDLSLQSLRRSKFRNMFQNSNLHHVHQDINDFLRASQLLGHKFGFIQSFGVLHHLPDPRLTLKLLASHLKHESVLRVMVYNSQGRDFIHRIQDFLSQLQLNPFVGSDIRTAKLLVKTLASCSPRYHERLRCMGPSILENTTRFADAFFNPHELRWNISEWLTTFEECGFQVFALFDRYGELDDLQNPLLVPPSILELKERSMDRRFEGNLEIFLRPLRVERDENSVTAPSGEQLIPRSLYWKSPPRNWFDFPETLNLSWMQRKLIWKRFLSHLEDRESGIHDKKMEQLNPNTLQRLSRMGAIFPDQFKTKAIRDTLYQPIKKNLTPLPNPEVGNFSEQHFIEKLTELGLREPATLEKIKKIFHSQKALTDLKSIS